VCRHFKGPFYLQTIAVGHFSPPNLYVTIALKAHLLQGQTEFYPLNRQQKLFPKDYRNKTLLTSRS